MRNPILLIKKRIGQKSNRKNATAQRSCRRVTLSMLNREYFAKKYPELDPLSPKFDPLKALQSPNVLVTLVDRRAPIFYSVKEFEHHHREWLRSTGIGSECQRSECSQREDRHRSIGHWRDVGKIKAERNPFRKYPTRRESTIQNDRQNEKNRIDGMTVAVVATNDVDSWKCSSNFERPKQNKQ